MDREKAAVVLEKLSEGLSLRKSAKAAGCVAATVLNWTKEDAEFAEQYARAREQGYALLADEIIEISDDSGNDEIVDDNGNSRMNAEFVARSRLRVDSRKWMLSKMLPKIYGDRLTTDVNLSVRDLGDDELKARAEKLQALLASAAVPNTPPDDSASD